MTLTIWNKYTFIKEVDKKSNIKTYLARIEPIIKEISYKNKNEYLVIREKLERIKNKIKIYDIIEEEDKIFIVIDNNNEIISEIDQLILKNKSEIKKEGILKGQGNPVTKKEIIELFNMEKSMCKIFYEKIEDNEIKKGNASGFFCEIDEFPIKYGLFTNNHVLDENDIKKGNIINIECLNELSYIKKKIKLDGKRKVYTNIELDYTCIEIYQSDGFKDYFKIDPILFNNKKYLNNSDIFILQYPDGNELSFSYGKVLSLEDNDIYHSASTKDGSSGSPIIRRSEDNYIIGLHKGGIKKFSFNLATCFDSILNNINKPNKNIKQEKFNKKNLEKIENLLHLYFANIGILSRINYYSNINDNEKKSNNIIYYDSNISCLSNINQDIDDFEEITPGAFILSTNMDSFNLIRAEILMLNKKDKRIIFNLITTGSQIDDVMRFLDEEPKFKNCISHILVYCPDIQKLDQLKNKYDLVYDVVSSKEEVINFIKNFSSEEIKPYPIVKLITLKDYLIKFKVKHFILSQFYGNLNIQTFKDHIEKMKSLMKQEYKEEILKIAQNKILENILTFDLEKDLNLLGQGLLKINSCDEALGYFKERIMYCLNEYAKQEGKYLESDKTILYRGSKLSYSDILQYERAKGKIIILSSFTSTFPEVNLAKRFSQREKSQSLYKSKLKFSVIFIIINNFKKDWISNGIIVSDPDQKYKYKEEILFQPFSFFYVRDVEIDLINYKADIYLETIGKKEILEEKIKFGKEINYNEHEKIMEVK